MNRIIIQRSFPLLIAMVLLCLLSEASSYAASTDEVARQLREMLEDRKLSPFPPGQFNPASFDPQKFDPLLVEASWESSRRAIIAYLNRKLGSNLSLDHGLALFVSPVRETSSRTPASPKMKKTKPSKRKKTKQGEKKVERYRILFIDADEKVASVLMNALALPKECFLKLSKFPAIQMMQLSGFKTRYRTEQTLRLDVIASDCAQLINEPDGLFRHLGFESAPPFIRDDRVTVTTNWQFIKETSDFEFYWRVYFEVNKARPDGWNITTKVDMGRKSPSESPSRIRVFEDFQNSDRYKSLLELHFDNAGVNAFVTTENYVYHPDSGTELPLDVKLPYQVSPIAELRHAMFNEFKTMLLREEK